jgi:hypothetical protein
LINDAIIKGSSGKECYLNKLELGCHYAMINELQSYF